MSYNAANFRALHRIGISYLEKRILCELTQVETVGNGAIREGRELSRDPICVLERSERRVAKVDARAHIFDGLRNNYRRVSAVASARQSSNRPNRQIAKVRGGDER